MTALGAQDAAFYFMYFMALLFVAGYSRIFPWWTHYIGRSLVAFDLVVMVTLFPGFLHLLFHVSTSGSFYIWYRTTCYAVSGITFGWRLRAVRRASKKEDHNNELVRT